MNTLRRKMLCILDELTKYFFALGSDDLNVRILRLTDGYKLILTSYYPPEKRKEVEALRRFLSPAQKMPSMENFFWELAGASDVCDDSELQLIGQMLDEAEITISEDLVRICAVKKKA